METALHGRGRELPETVIAHTANRLRNHVLWDSLLIFSPPLLVAIYVATYLYRLAWIEQITYLFVTVTLVSVAVIAAAVRYRPLVPSLPAAARLVDGKAAAEDRFMTLATIVPNLHPTSLIARLRQEAASLADRIDLKRDFRYRTKRSFYLSLIASLLGVAVFHLLLLTASPLVPRVPPHEKIRELAQKMAQTPRLAEIAKGLQALVAKLEDPKAPNVEKHAQTQEMLRKIEEQQKKEEQQKQDGQGNNRDLLDQAANTLRGMEQGAGSEESKDQEKGGGSVQTNLPQEGQGQGKSKEGSGGDSKAELNLQLNKEMQQGKVAQGDPKEQGKEKNLQNPGDGKGNQPDKNRQDREKPGETGKTQGPREEKVGRSKVSEEIPQGAPPADRFVKPGEEGKEGIKGAGYVTVQLPEELLADSKSEGGLLKASKETKVRPKVPISNVPLPAHVPDAPTEKQHVPLEYRGIIR